MRVCFIGIRKVQLETMKMKFDEGQEFLKEFKKLKKKYKSLNNDLEIFKKLLEAHPLGISRHTNILIRSHDCIVIKSRLFCRYLKGNTLRIVYLYIKKNSQIIFIEIFFKGEKAREDQQRIKDYAKNI